MTDSDVHAQLSSVGLPIHTLNAKSLNHVACLEILNALPTQVWHKDADNNILWVNQAASTYVGMEASDIIGLNMADLFAKSNMSFINQINEQLRTTHKAVLGVVHPSHSQHDAQVHWLKTDHLPLTDDDGAFHSILVLCNDITELQQARSQLEQATRLFDTFMQHSPLMDWVQDEEGHYIIVNKAYEQFMNVPARDVIGKLPHEVQSPFINAKLISLANKTTQETLTHNQPIQFEAKVQREDKEHTLLVTKFLLELPSHRKAVGGIAVDITDLKEAEEKLRKIKQRYELAVNGTADGLWDWDTGPYCWYSERYKQLLGFEDTDHFSNRIEDSTELIHIDDRPHVWKAVNAHLEHDAKYDVEFRLRCKDGQYKWFRARANSIRDKHGKALRMSGSIQDVHDRVMAQEQLAELNRKLEQRVRERTAQLAQARDEMEARVLERTAELAHTNELLAIRNNELDQFAHIAAHDLRSPLRTIAGFAAFLKEILDESDNQQASEYITRILGAATRMESLIDSLLTFSRVGRSDMKFTSVDLNDLLEEVKANMASEITESNAHIHADTLPTIECDATLIGLVFQNLIGNSIRYCVDKEPVIQIGYELTETEHILCFADNGEGFTEKDTAQIFEPFQRLNTPSRKQTAGHGVGLSICKRIIKRHDGRIYARSQPGEGASFYLALPCDR